MLPNLIAFGIFIFLLENFNSFFLSLFFRKNEDNINDGIKFIDGDQHKTKGFLNIITPII